MQTPNPATERTPDAMNHPPQEEWMGYLYGELPAAENARLAAHLGQCAHCMGRMEKCRDTMRQLSEWKLPPSLRVRRGRRFPRWAAAAALALGLGLALGWTQSRSARSREAAALKTELRQELQTEFAAQLAQQRAQVLAEAGRIVDEKRIEDNRAIFTALREMGAQQRADLDSFHKELETMALLTETSFRQAQQQIVNLAGAAGPNPN